MMPWAAAAWASGREAGQTNPSAPASAAEVGREAVSAGRQPAQVGQKARRKAKSAASQLPEDAEVDKQAVSAASQLPEDGQQSSPPLQEGTGSEPLERIQIIT